MSKRLSSWSALTAPHCERLRAAAESAAGDRVRKYRSHCSSGAIRSIPFSPSSCATTAVEI